MNPFCKALGLLLAGAMAVAAPAAFAAETYVNVLTGGTSGVYYPLGVALANVDRQATCPRSRRRCRRPRHRSRT